MTRQTMLQVKKESQPLQTGSLFRRQAAQVPVEEHDTAPLPVGFGRDYSHIPFRQPQPPPPMASISCPFSPQRCPFGGACHACPPKMQAKLKIGQPGDQYEQEADRMAETVMRMPEPQVQRKCSAPGCKEEDDEKKLLQTKPASAGEAGAQVDHPLIQSVLSSPGQPLDAGTRNFMEPRFGQDFSGVRVHVGGAAAESARAVNARAYTVGRDVVFGEGQYAPGSDEGKRLVAHELTHVVQQNGGGDSSSISKKDISIQRGLSTLCNAPSHWGMPPYMWLLIGELAHFLGRGDYLTKMGGTRGIDIYFDIIDLISIDPNYAPFIIRNNPSLASWKQVFLIFTPLKRPDYMIHRGGLTEFDELKPNSISGVPAGVEKIYEIAGYMRLLGLPYRFGTSYRPIRMIPLGSVSVGGIPINVSLKYERYMSGLIVYEICIETDWFGLAKAAVIAAVIAFLVFITRRLPVPAPPPVPALAAIDVDGNTQQLEFNMSSEVVSA